MGDAITAGCTAGIFVLLLIYMMFPPTAEDANKHIWADVASATCAPHGGVTDYDISQIYDSFLCGDGSGPFYLDYDGNVIGPSKR